MKQIPLKHVPLPVAARLERRPVAGQQSLDALVTHPFWGLVILIGILGVILFVTYQLALPAAVWIQHVLLDGIGGLLLTVLAGAPELLKVFLVDGLLAGVGTAFSFIPVLLVFFAAMAVLEESGYLFRASIVMDRYLKRLGLPGIACVPLSMAFGCNTPAIMGCRLVRDPRSRILTMLLIPFVPCTSRLAAIIFLTPIFFGSLAPLVTWGLIALNLSVLALTARFVRNVGRRRGVVDQMIQLPDYHLPTLGGMGRYIWKNLSEFLVKIGTLIPVLSLIVWVLSYFPNGDMHTSYLAGLGRGLLPVGQWMGIADWRFIVALLASFVSKENSIAVLGILFPVSAAAAGQGTFLGQIAAVLPPASAVAFLVMQMLFIPCAATLAAIRSESGRKPALLSMGLMMMVSLVVGVVIYQVGRLL